MMFTKIQVIQILRQNIDGLGLKEAKDLVDAYEVRGFEDRVIRAMGEDARNELRTWARVYAKECGMSYVKPTYEYPYECTCDLCIAEGKASDYKEVVLK